MGKKYFKYTSFSVLGLEKTSTVEEIKARWKHLASETHPDKGGDSEEFNKYRQAYTEALAIASEPKPCTHCGGKGKLEVTSGFTVMSVRCNPCNGKGIQL